MATQEQMDTLRAQAFNDTAREMAADGVELSYEQAAEIGDDGVAWIERRLGLRVTETDECVECEVVSG